MINTRLTILTIGMTFLSINTASAITINNGVYGNWDTEIILNLGPHSNLTTIESGLQVYETQTTINGSLSIYLNMFYPTGQPTVGVNFDNTFLDGSTNSISFSPENTISFTLNNNPASTSTLDFHTMDFESANDCSINPEQLFCSNFNAGNSSINPFPAIGTVEAGYDITLDLGFISLLNRNDGSTAALLDLSNDNFQYLSLNISAGDSYGNSTSYVFDTSPVPLPASVWLFSSGCISLFGFSKFKQT